MIRSRRIVTGLALLAVGGGAAILRTPGAAARGPIESPLAATDVRIDYIANVRHLHASAARARLELDTLAPDAPAELLWLKGSTTAPSSRGAVVIDAGGSVVEFDRRLRPSFRPLDAEGRTWVSVASAVDGALWLSDATGALLRADPAGRIAPVAPGSMNFPTVASDGKGGTLWLVRSPRNFGSTLPTGAEPLLERRDAARDLTRDASERIGRAITPAHVLLQDLANAGTLAVTASQVVFAPFIRDEVVALSFTGETLWVAHRELPQHTIEPRFEIEDGQAVVAYHPVNLGARIGPDGRLYVLSTPGFTTSRTRLDVFDPADGALLRSAELATATPTLAADAEGRVYVLDAPALLAGMPSRARDAVPDFAMPLLDGDTLDPSTFRGRVSLVNVWASWCEPCRAEMPALDSLQRSIGDSTFRFVSLNDDVDEGAARRYLVSGGFTFPVALGRGAVRGLLHAPGMPVTLLVDAEGREIRRWIGYAGPDQIAGIGALIRSELRRLPAASTPLGGHQHAH